MTGLHAAPWTMRKVTAKEVSTFLDRELKDIPLYQKTGVKANDVEKIMEKWTLVGLFAQEEIFGVIGCDPEGSTHIQIAEAWQHFWQVRSSIVRALSLLFTEHEQLTATFPFDNAPAKKLCEMVGGQLVSNDGKELTYMLSKSDFQPSVTYQT
jgi:hypothetical protein